MECTETDWSITLLANHIEQSVTISVCGRGVQERVCEPFALQAAQCLAVKRSSLPLC